MEGVYDKPVGSLPMSAKIISIHANDNVAVVVNAEGLKTGTDVSKDLVASEDIPHGQKIALTDIEVDQDVIRYGEIIGQANQSGPQANDVVRQAV